MGFEHFLECVRAFHSAHDLIEAGELIWMLWATRQIVSIRESLGKLNGEVEVLRNGRRVTLDG